MASEATRRASQPRLGVLAQWFLERPAAAFVTVIAVGAIFLRSGLSAAALVSAFAAAVLIAIAWIDIEEHRVPNKIVVPAGLLVLAARILTAPNHTVAWVVAAFASFGCFFLLALLWPGALGMGDVKLAFLIGAALGSAVLDGFFAASLAAAAAALVVIAREGAHRRRSIPFAPFLALGTMLTLLMATP
jgi:leader peptidase (prepilin peptidase)/N-methyltransferase